MVCYLIFCIYIVCCNFCNRRGNKKDKGFVWSNGAKREGFVSTTESRFWGYQRNCTQPELYPTKQTNKVVKIILWQLKLKYPGNIIRRELFRLENGLPALAKRKEIEEHLKTNTFVVIKGNTGSGKSTQVPAYIADMPQFSNMKVNGF